jgi:hypothetical protein
MHFIMYIARILALFAALLSLSNVQFLAAQTAWTGAISQAWTDPLNWSNGVPNQGVAASVGPAANQPLVTAAVECGGLAIAVGSALVTTGSGRVCIHGDATFSADVIGDIEFPYTPSPQATPYQAIFVNGAHVTSVVTGYLVNVDFTDLRADTLTSIGWSPSPVLLLHGTTTLVNATLGSGFACDANGALYVSGTLDASGYAQLPLTVSVGNLQVQSTAGIGSVSGVIIVPSGGATRITTNSHIGNVEVRVQAGALFSYKLYSGFLPTHFLTIGDSSGEVELASLHPLLVDVGSIDGHMFLDGPNISLRDPVTGLAPVVAAGGSLNLRSDAFTTPWSTQPPTVANVTGDLLVDGHLDVGSPGAAAVLEIESANPGVPAVLRIDAAGSLTLQGPSNDRSIIRGVGSEGVAIEVEGTIGASYAEFINLGPDGLRLADTASIAPTPLDLANCKLSSSQATPGATLLTVERLAPTAIRDLELQGSTPFGVRATALHAVALVDATGNRSGAAWEDDPLGVVTWDAGVSYAGGGTTFCSPLAVCSANGEPKIGNAAFALECSPVPASGLGLFALGSPSTAGFPALGLQVWLDPSQPIALQTMIASSQGAFVALLPIPLIPGLVGYTQTGQFLILEPAGCGLSSFAMSTSITMTITQ